MKKKIRKHCGGLKPDKYLSDEQLEILMKHLRENAKTKRGSLNQFIVSLLLYSGLRAEELLNLKFRDTSRCHCKNIIMVSRGKGSVSRTVLVPEILQVLIPGRAQAGGQTWILCFGSREQNEDDV
jgi:integrase